MDKIKKPKPIKVTNKNLLICRNKALTKSKSIYKKALSVSSNSNKILEDLCSLSAQHEIKSILIGVRREYFYKEHISIDSFAS